jgi:hypothetical protein
MSHHLIDLQTNFYPSEGSRERRRRVLDRYRMVQCSKGFQMA